MATKKRSFSFILLVSSCPPYILSPLPFIPNLAAPSSARAKTREVVGGYQGKCFIAFVAAANFFRNTLLLTQRKKKTTKARVQTQKRVKPHISIGHPSLSCLHKRPIVSCIHPVLPIYLPVSNLRFVLLFTLSKSELVVPASQTSKKKKKKKQ
ncbi:hypothetical protein B0J12DRAFT_37910 [Macrophomina phaseolina]|uniref:Secreted protein n=1 Tax=Macrophomina phaseolina TaxID=35725 RepID=A0ABQ8GW61_9PEZI|nr:hypothetical protein B0J12DRAFT_37910 [Macrophomina phaseolina]